MNMKFQNAYTSICKMVRYAVSVYTFPTPSSKGHSFLLGNYHGGLTEILQDIDFNELRITFARLRPLIEQKNDGVMCVPFLLRSYLRSRFLHYV